MRELDRGEEFVVTRNGVPVGELRPVRPRQFIPTSVLQDALKGVGRIDPDQFRADIDSYVNQDPTPRGWPDE